MTSYVDYSSPSTQFTFDVNTNTIYKKDDQNFINLLGIQQLNSLENVSLLDFSLSANNVIEPHYHQNAAELVYCISGFAKVSMINPFIKQLQEYEITPGQVVNVPQGWWHYVTGIKDHTHLLAIFDAPTPEVILGSDILKIMPPKVMAHTYCLDEQQWNHVIAPMKPSTNIGPPADCNSSVNNTSMNYPYYHQYYNPYYSPQGYRY